MVYNKKTSTEVEVNVQNKSMKKSAVKEFQLFSDKLQRLLFLDGYKK